MSDSSVNFPLPEFSTPDILTKHKSFTDSKALLVIAGPMGKKSHPMFMDPRDNLDTYIEGDLPDEEMKGMSVDDQKWYVVQKGFAQVKRFCEECGLPDEYYKEKFLRWGYFTANHLRLISKHILIDKFLLTDANEIETILSKSATLKSDEIVNFVDTYGHVEQLIMECEKGKAWWEENRFEYEHKPGHTHEVYEMSFAEKFPFEKQELDSFSFDGEWAAVSCADGAICLWPLSTDNDGPACVRAAHPHMGLVCTDFVMDWKRMRSASVGGNCRANLWDFEQDKSIAEVKNNTSVNVSEVFLSLDVDHEVGKVAIGAARGYLKIGDFETGKLVMASKIHTDSIYGVSADFDLNQVVTTSWDKTVGVFDIRSGKRVRKMEGHTFVINRVETNFGMQLALSAGADENIMLWDFRQGECVKSVKTGHIAGCNCAAVNWSTMAVATGGEDGTVKLWDLQTGECQKTYEDMNHIQTLALDVDWEKGWLMTCSWDVKTRVWDLQTGRKLKELHKQRRCLTQCSLTGGRHRRR